MDPSSIPSHTQKLLRQIEQAIREYALLPAGGRVLVAISGGPDSVFLAWALRELGYEIGLAHINYQLRGEDSEREEALVRQYAQDWGVPLFVQRADPRPLVELGQDSLQMVARKIRYTFFEETMAGEAYAQCATAHHQDDQLETLVMQWLRGNPQHPMPGIPRQRGAYVRPLLDLTKADILRSLEELQLPFGLDQSNTKQAYLRNQIRHRLIPIMRDLQPQLNRQLVARHAWLGGQQQFIDQLLERELPAALRPQGPVEELSWGDFLAEYGPDALPLLVQAALHRWGIRGHLGQACQDLIDSE
ncbi:MAG: tRNA lysidine(34) synthetase TilS, partial [Bacteroidetes bacterium]